MFKFGPLTAFFTGIGIVYGLAFGATPLEWFIVLLPLLIFLIVLGLNYYLGS